MAEIINTKKQKDKILLQLTADYDEALQLQGHLTEVRLFSENIGFTKANMSQRGKNSATKYFLIPREMRKDLKFNEKVSCQRIDTEKKTFFIYVVRRM